MSEADFSVQEPEQKETSSQEVENASTGEGEKRKSEDVIFLILAYFGIFALIPFFVVKDNEFVRWHSKQGLVLVGFEIILWIVLMIIGFVPILNIIFAFLGLFIWLGILILHILCIVKALKGEKWYVPVVGKYADKF
jgi:uncharacterized membrane protein